MNGMGFLNTPVHDPLTASRGSRKMLAAPAPAMRQPQQQQQQQQPARQNYPIRRQNQSQAQQHHEPSVRLPPMYESAPTPPPSAAPSTNGLLDMWRQKRAAAKSTSSPSMPDLKAQPFPQAEYNQPQQPTYQPPNPQQNLPIAPYPKVQPMPTPAVQQPHQEPLPPPTAAIQQQQQQQQPTAYMTSEYLANLRQELINLVTTQAPKQDLEQRLIPINHRFQDYDVRLNVVKSQVEQTMTSLKSIQMQSNSDRRMLLNNISPDDFKALHSDLNEALKTWITQAEETINNVLQEFSDRSFAVYCEVIHACPVLSQPSFLAAVENEIPVGTRLKVCYPQTQTAEGTFCRCISVTSWGELSLFWIPLHRKVDDVRFVANFQV